MMTNKTGFAIVAMLAAGACSTAPRSPRELPVARDGREVLTQMHAAYEGKWYRTLTFIQKTTMRRADAPDKVTTWYEAISAPDRLRIDIGDPSLGNGVIYTSDSTYVVREGKLVRATAQGNEFLPFVEAVYTQPVAETVRDVEAFGFDLSRIRTDTWEGRPVYVVGAANAQDLVSKQFWIDRERLVIVRMIVKFDPKPDAKPHDIAIGGYVPLEGGWLATRITIAQEGGSTQVEEYTEWKANTPLSPELFDPAKWSATQHWSKKTD
jgi:hypothetical protein